MPRAFARYESTTMRDATTRRHDAAQQTCLLMPRHDKTAASPTCVEYALPRAIYTITRDGFASFHERVPRAASSRDKTLSSRVIPMLPLSSSPNADVLRRTFRKKHKHVAIMPRFHATFVYWRSFNTFVATFAMASSRHLSLPFRRHARCRAVIIYEHLRSRCRRRLRRPRSRAIFITFIYRHHHLLASVVRRRRRKCRCPLRMPTSLPMTPTSMSQERPTLRVRHARTTPSRERKTRT